MKKLNILFLIISFLLTSCILPKNSSFRDAMGSIASGGFGRRDLQLGVVQGYPNDSKELQKMWELIEEQLKDQDTTQKRIKKLKRMGMNCFYINNRQNIECRYKLVRPIPSYGKDVIFTISIDPEIGMDSIMFSAFKLTEEILQKQASMSIEEYKKYIFSGYSQNLNKADRLTGETL